MKLDDLLSMKMAEYNVLVRMDPVEQRTAGGIILTNDAVDRDALSRDVGTLVNVGEHSFSYVKEWKGGAPQPGDRVLIAMYDGKLYDVDGEKFRVLKDKSVVAWWPAEQPASLAAAA
jgi:co-chaperonin GroES (HSP10)